MPLRSALSYTSSTVDEGWVQAMSRVVRLGWSHRDPVNDHRIDMPSGAVDDDAGWLGSLPIRNGDLEGRRLDAVEAEQHDRRPVRCHRHGTRGQRGGVQPTFPIEWNGSDAVYPGMNFEPAIRIEPTGDYPVRSACFEHLTAGNEAVVDRRQSPELHLELHG